MTMIRWTVFVLALFFTTLTHASSILPYKSLAVLAENSDAAGVYLVKDFRAVNHGEITYLEYRLVPQDPVKGPQEGELTVQCLTKIYSDHEFAVPDDLNLETGHSYLLFLNRKTDGYYRAKTFNYYVFEQVIMDDRLLLVPSVQTLEIKGTELRSVEEFATLDQETLVTHLTEVLNNHISYDPDIVKAPARYAALESREAPSYCTYFGLRWDVFNGGGNLPVYADATPDQYNSGCYTFVQNAIAGMNSGYNGNVNLSYAGTAVLNSNSCDGGFDPTIQGLGSTSILVVFNDPCSEVSDFNCDPEMGPLGGALGIGGIASATGMHTFNGTDWYTAAYGYVVINDGLSCFNNASAWESLLMHEMTHALGLGHIAAANGAALMNPSCCNPITSLDQSCVSFAYDAALPVQLISFDANLDDDLVSINWKTAWEVDHDYFEVLHSSDGQTWEVIDRVSQGTLMNENQKQYRTSDRNPAIGINYYQLNQVDIDGQSELSPIVQVPFYPLQWARISPNPVGGDQLFLEFSSARVQNWEIHILDVTGVIRQSVTIASANRYIGSHIDISSLKPGVYFIRFPEASGMETLRFVKQ